MVLVGADRIRTALDLCWSILWQHYSVHGLLSSKLLANLRRFRQASTADKASTLDVASGEDQPPVPQLPPHILHFSEGADLQLLPQHIHGVRRRNAAICEGLHLYIVRLPRLQSCVEVALQYRCLLPQALQDLTEVLRHRICPRGGSGAT